MKLPETIFKYEGTGYNSLINLKAQSFYMASPLTFNDPYDCALGFQVNDLSDEDISKTKQYLIEAKELPNQKKEQIQKMSPAELNEMIKRNTVTAATAGRNEFVQHCGVTCFSEVRDELLMWAHYSDKYKGFCLEFRTDIEPFNSNLRKVKYKSKLPLIDGSALLLSEDYNQVIDLLFTKSESWSYEKEWRLLHNAAGTVYSYPAESLKAIYFGPKIDVHFREILCLIIQGQNPDVEFWQGAISDKEFKLDFTKVEYTPYIIAKSKGLRA